MADINFKRRLPGNVEGNLDRVIEALKGEGYGVLTRIDFHQKMKEKLGREIPPTIILGACNPAMAMEAFDRNSDVTALLPCNVVLRQLSAEEVSVEIVRSSSLMDVLGDAGLTELAKDADQKLLKALKTL